ncbi:hypothetical protein [Sinisalibacter lacisalsi]|uniref:Uncharacterized protein n=1 Tax=Sinisalibacter lacisalsi TaxID=1526570 RepID=A0ABQ1QMG8_9RHOB|nr:hypothetical protein [Sinisalibacter lacisalsi]GGD36509.1 hypothetical protein GCM10011358_20430 [Sinisalibacter lacisalsi]
MAEKIIRVQNEFGLLWFAGWLFTLGWLGLGFWKSVLALIVWPYFIGAALAAAGAG